MRSSAGSVLVPLIVLLGFVVVLDAGGPSKMKKPRPINWNHSYYSGKFDLCKKLRIFNPVELVKAQSWAVAAFRKCGPKLIVKYATKYNFPAFGLEFLARLGCLGITFSYSYFAGDGTLVIPDNVKTVWFYDLAMIAFRALTAANYTLTLRRRGYKTVRYTLNEAAEVGFEGLRCVFDEEFVTQTDGDVLKHAVNHVKVLLL